MWDPLQKGWDIRAAVIALEFDDDRVAGFVRGKQIKAFDRFAEPVIFRRDN